MDQPEIEAVFAEALQNIAEGVTQLLGFEVAAISIARDDHTLEMVAVAGSTKAREQLLGRRRPIAETERVLATAEEWGDLSFVSHEVTIPEADEPGWVPDLEPSDDPDGWHPLDRLLSPIHDEKDRLRGLLSVDVPRDGRRPDAVQRDQLQHYARQARRSVLTAVERAEFAERVRLADTARRIVRQVSSELSIARIVEICQPAIAVGFDAAGMWLQTFDAAGGAADAVYGATEGTVLVPDEFKLVGREAARALWCVQDVLVVTLGARPVIPDLALDDGQVQRLHDFMATTLEASSMLFVPLGAGPECLGNLALTRRGPNTEWSSMEQQAALEIGHDLGRALVNARTFERERLLLEEQRALAVYKSQLIATISHELKTPLTSILGHLELMGFQPEPSDSVTRSTAAIRRGAERMRSTIEDLLLLAQVADPDAGIDAAPVDLASVVEDVLQLLSVTVDQKRLRVVMDATATPMTVWGEANELFQLCVNLVSNAVKYTPPGGTIAMSLARTPNDVQLVVADTGIGISAGDQDRLFEEFFRSTNPTALATPGTGLGLSIVYRVVNRHHGKIEVKSKLGTGTTFTVSLPAPP